MTHETGVWVLEYAMFRDAADTASLNDTTIAQTTNTRTCKADSVVRNVVEVRRRVRLVAETQLFLNAPI